MQSLAQALAELANARLDLLGPEAIQRSRYQTIRPTASVQTSLSTTRQRLSDLKQLVEDAARLQAQEQAEPDRATVREYAEQIDAAKRTLAAFEKELSWAQERDEFLAGRPAGCACFGLGGAGLLHCIGGGPPAWTVPCEACPEGRAMLQARQDYWAEVQPEIDRERAAEAAAAAEKERADLMDAAGIPERMRDFTLANFPFEESKRRALSLCKRLVLRQPLDEHDDRKIGLFLHGAFGTGKTSLACATIRAWIERHNRTGLLVTAGDYIDWLKWSFARRSTGADPTSHQVFDRVQGVALLTIDDLGASRATEFARAELFKLINARHGAQRPTIFTSNYTLTEIATTLAGDDDPREGVRITDRIVEVCVPVELVGRNLRREPPRATDGGPHVP